MLTALGFASTLQRGASTFLGWFLKYPREMIILVMGIYIVFCQLTHNGPLTKGGECPQAIDGDTISDIVTETVIFDSTKVELDVSKPAPVSEEEKEPVTWERPVLAVDPSSDCRDSVAELVSSLGWYEFSLSECEERLNELAKVRTYKDSSRNDSMVVGYEFKVLGSLVDSVSLWYKRTTPYVSTTRTITKVEVRGPYRKIGLGAGIGYINEGQSFKPGGIETVLKASYSDKKNNQVILQGGYIFQNQPGWKIGVGYVRNFNIKL